MATRRQPPTRNPVARGLRSPALRPRVVKPKKGKGSYRRKRTRPVDGDS